MGPTCHRLGGEEGSSGRNRAGRPARFTAMPTANDAFIADATKRENAGTHQSLNPARWGLDSGGSGEDSPATADSARRRRRLHSVSHLRNGRAHEATEILRMALKKENSWGVHRRKRIWQWWRLAGVGEDDANLQARCIIPWDSWGLLERTSRGCWWWEDSSRGGLHVAQRDLLRWSSSAPSSHGSRVPFCDGWNSRVKRDSDRHSERSMERERDDGERGLTTIGGGFSSMAGDEFEGDGRAEGTPSPWARWWSEE